MHLIYAARTRMKFFLNGDSCVTVHSFLRLTHTVLAVQLYSFKMRLEMRLRLAMERTIAGRFLGDTRY